MRRWMILGLLAVGLVVVIGVAISVVGDDADFADYNEPRIPGLHPEAGDQVLSRGPNWVMVVTDDQALELRAPWATSRASHYTRPITLNEASVSAVPRRGGLRTVVAGPVDGDAVSVVVETAAGLTRKARLLTASDLHWFFVELPGAVRIAAITARNSEHVIVDQTTLPVTPPPIRFPPPPPARN